MIKLPRTLHLEGSRTLPGKPDPEAIQFDKLKGKLLVVEEKVDGTGVAIEFDASQDKHTYMQAFHRGTKLEGRDGEFYAFYDWRISHIDDLFDLLTDRYILFGEWMQRKHHIFYDRLPHLFLESDVYDKYNNLWLSTKTREELFRNVDFIRHVPVLDRGTFNSLSEITDLIGRSRYQSEHWPSMLWHYCEMEDIELDKVLHHTDKSHKMEGLYIKYEDDKEVLGRYKYVRYDFVNDIVNMGVHWKMQKPVNNLLINGWQYTALLK